jgi:hypothetical protein
VAKKQLDTSAIANELQHSAFFPSAQPAPAQPSDAPGEDLSDSRPPSERIAARTPVTVPVTSPAHPYARTAETTVGAEALAEPIPAQSDHQLPPPTEAASTMDVQVYQENRPAVRESIRTPVRLRTITRYAFEFYQDQIDSLRHYSLDEKLRGEKGSMSQMVREAIDAYLAKRRRDGD